MKYFCTSCTYTYDQWLWDIKDGIPAGTSTYEIEYCPWCWESNCFQWVEEEVNYCDEDQSFLAEDHEIVYKITDDIIEVIVADGDHGMWDDHRITTISLYDEYGDLDQSIFLDIDADPVADFDISQFDDFEIRVKCSMHWVWGKKISR